MACWPEDGCNSETPIHRSPRRTRIRPARRKETNTNDKTGASASAR
jgi:hypothetical protein